MRYPVELIEWCRARYVFGVTDEERFRRLRELLPTLMEGGAEVLAILPRDV